MLNVAVFFGGRSVEHDVSIVTAQQLMQNIDRKTHKVIPVYITRDGDWFSGAKLSTIEAFQHFDKGDPSITRVYIPANTKAKQLYRFNTEKKLLHKADPVFEKIDVAILAMHGLNGEDGTPAGTFRIGGYSLYQQRCAGFGRRYGQNFDEGRVYRRRFSGTALHLF